MSEATSALKDIKQALEDYGTSITLRFVIQGEYDPLTGQTETSTDIDLKAIIKNNKTEKDNNALQYKGRIEGVVNSEVLELMLYSDVEPTKKDKIVFNNVEYDITKVTKSILQGTVLKYEILARK